MISISASLPAEPGGKKRKNNMEEKGNELLLY